MEKKGIAEESKSHLSIVTQSEDDEANLLHAGTNGPLLAYWF